MHNRVISRKCLNAIIFFLLLVVFVSMPIFAESKATKNKKAIALYEKKGVELVKKSRAHVERINGTYIDFTGDGVKEALFVYPSNNGSGLDFEIYSYKNGKIRNILTDGGYGIEWFGIYKKSKSIIMYQAGHGGETYRYYKMNGGKYKYLACKYRSSRNGGSARNGSWMYATGQSLTYRSITKAEFNKAIKGVKKGKKKTIKMY